MVQRAVEREVVGLFFPLRRLGVSGAGHDPHGRLRLTEVAPGDARTHEKHDELHIGRNRIPVMSILCIPKKYVQRPSG